MSSRRGAIGTASAAAGAASRIVLVIVLVIVLLHTVGDEALLLLLRILERGNEARKRVEPLERLLRLPGDRLLERCERPPQRGPLGGQGDTHEHPARVGTLKGQARATEPALGELAMGASAGAERRLDAAKGQQLAMVG